MEESKKWKLSCVAANLISWYRQHVSEVEQVRCEQVEPANHSPLNYPFWDEEKLYQQWKFWSGHPLNTDDPDEIALFQHLVGIISLLNKIDE